MSIDIYDKKFLIMGLGLHGGGLAISKFLLANGANLTITDLRTERTLSASICQLKEYKSKIRYVLGYHDELDFIEADIVVKNPGVRSDNKYLKLAKRIETDISLFLMFNKNPIIAVTGSKGKSTLSNLVYQVLKVKYKSTQLGGNIGKSPFEFLASLDGFSPVVLELSSWQLHSLKDFSPLIGIITNIYKDHMNSYSNFTDYVEDKANIFLNNANGILICQDIAFNCYFSNFKVANKLFLFSQHVPKDFTNDIFYIKENFLYLNSKKIFKLCETNLVLRIAKMLSFFVAYYLKLDLNLVSKVLKVFKGIEHRLELVRTINGIQFFNDTASTIPDSTIISVESLKFSNKNIILITGGTDKLLDFSGFKKIFPLVKTWILLKGSATNKIMYILNKNIIPFILFNNLNDCVFYAKECAHVNDIVLFSPASASFELFDNEFDRGLKFKALVKALD